MENGHVLALDGDRGQVLPVVEDTPLPIALRGMRRAVSQDTTLIAAE